MNKLTLIEQRELEKKADKRYSVPKIAETKEELAELKREWNRPGKIMRIQRELEHHLLKSW